MRKKNGNGKKTRKIGKKIGKTMKNNCKKRSGK